MRNLGMRGRLGLMALACGLVVAPACSDEDTDGNTDETTEDSGPGDKQDSGSKQDSGGGDDEDAAIDIDGAVEGDAGTEDAGDEPDAASPYGRLPSAFSFSGCNATVGVPALCSVTQTEGTFSANCAGVTYTGTIAANSGDLTLTRPNTTNTATATVSFSCTGKLERDGSVSLACKQNTTAAGETPAAEATCDLKSAKSTLPGISCLELPATLSDVVVCKEGAANDATTLTGGNCKVTQDACNFQAECQNDVTLNGTVTKTGISFTRRLKALADAATNATTGAVAFLKGAETNHTCVGNIVEGKFDATTSKCSAGNSGQIPATSVCTNEATVPSVGSCNLIAPKKDFLFVLDSCDILKNGEGGQPGIGQPVCAIQQNNCVWNIQCGEDPLTRFSGKLTPGATKIDFRLLTGTPCEVAVSASGVVSGSCTVQGEAPCMLRSIPAVPGVPGVCPALPANTDPRSNGCAGGDPLECRGTVQHGCNQVSICQFSTRYPDVVIAGKTSYGTGTNANRPHFEFNGVGGYKCYLDAALQSEIDSNDRAANEWYGDCVNAAGGRCRNTWNGTSGFRSLRVYWDPAVTPAQ